VPQETAGSQAAPGKAAPGYLALGRRGPGVLIALRDAGERRRLAEFLASNGFDAVAVGGPEQIREAMLHHGFAAVVADLSSPGGTGVELAEELRRTAPDTEVILLSGLASSAAVRRAKCERMGILAVLDRPCDPALLLTVVSEAVAGRRRNRLTRAPGPQAQNRPEEAAPLCALVLEDSADLSAVIAEVLAGRGFRVARAATLDQAREHLAGGGFDLVIADLWVPGGDGATATIRQLRRVDPHVPIVAMTGSDASAEALRSAGAAGHLAKPFAIKDLVELLTKLTRDARRGPSPRRGGRVRRETAKGGT
jgi:DNA-binding NtrC family response regulator